MTDIPASSDPLVIQYLGLRKAVGIIGMALPVGLACGNVAVERLSHLEVGVLGSISAYYYSDMRNVFVGSLCAVAVFLFSYRGFDWRDALASRIAAASLIGVALCPTTPEGEKRGIAGTLHITFAVVYFLTLAFFALVLFRKTDGNPTHEKLRRNRVYSVCGYSILLCLVLIVVAFHVPSDSPIQQLDPVFYLESVALLSFGISWFVKGEGILQDE
jgi:hypothetical protein